MSDKFRHFRVIDKVKESSVITSFYFKPDDQNPLLPAKPGQYLTLQIPVDNDNGDGNRKVLKTYSLSHDVSRTDYYRISVKRESAPLSQPDLPDGVGSCWLHEQLEIGDTINIAAPRGNFVLDETRQCPVVLLSGGVGQTPMLAMLHTLVATQRDAVYLHACENGEVHAMQAEITELVKTAQGRIHSHVVYRQPTQADRQLRAFDNEGYIDKALLKSLLPIDDCEVYLCGPPPFMQAMYLLLTDLGIPKWSIAYEFFGKGTPLEALVADEPVAKVSPSVASKAPKSIANLAFITNPAAWAIKQRPQSWNTGAVIDDVGGVVHFARSDITINWSSESKSLLELAEKNGLTPEYSCRSGICNSCQVALLDGEVEYFKEPLELPAKSELLLCSSRPIGDVVIDL